MDPVQTGEVEITAIHDVDRSSFDEQFVEDVDIGEFARGNPYYRRD